MRIKCKGSEFEKRRNSDIPLLKEQKMNELGTNREWELGKKAD